jgi:hypothetical protein
MCGLLDFASEIAHTANEAWVPAKKQLVRWMQRMDYAAGHGMKKGVERETAALPCSWTLSVAALPSDLVQ